MRTTLLSRKKGTFTTPGAADYFSPPHRTASNAPAPRTGGRQAKRSPARRPAPRGAERRLAPRLVLRRERCERENARAAGPAGDLLISDIAQLPATSASASACSRASLSHSTCRSPRTRFRTRTTFRSVDYDSLESKKGRLSLGEPIRRHLFLPGRDFFGHALHEKRLQRQISAGKLVSFSRTCLA